MHGARRVSSPLRALIWLKTWSQNTCETQEQHSFLHQDETWEPYPAHPPGPGFPLPWGDPAELGWGWQGGSRLGKRCPGSCRSGADPSGAFGQGALPVPVGTSAASAATRPRRAQQLIALLSARRRRDWSGAASLMLTRSTEGLKAAWDSKTGTADSSLSLFCV